MKRLLIIIVAVVSLAVSSPRYTHPNDVKYGGISFRFDTALANDVKSETVPASLFGKPCDIWPEHVAFSLVGYPRPRATPSGFPQLRVFSVERFRDFSDH